MAEKEYISKELELNAVEELETKPLPKLLIFDALKDCIKTIPAANVAEVVRCKDCIFRGREDCAMYFRCNCGEQHTWETDNDFCSYGERKELDNAELHLKHGHWKKVKGNERLTESGFVHDDRYICDRCEWGCCCETKLDFSYCPNCGAKMDGGEDNANT